MHTPIIQVTYPASFFHQITLFSIPIFPYVFKQDNYFTFSFPVMVTQKAEIFIMKMNTTHNSKNHVKYNLFPKESPWALGNYNYCYWPRDRVISHKPRGRELTVSALQFMNVKKKKKKSSSQKTNKTRKMLKKKEVFWQKFQKLNATWYKSWNQIQ